MITTVISCTTKSNQSPKDTLDSSRVYITTKGEYMGLATEKEISPRRLWVYKEEHRIIKQIHALVGEEMGVKCKQGRIWFLYIHKIATKNSWPKILKLIDQLSHLEDLILRSKDITSLNFKNLPRLKSLFVYDAILTLDILFVSPKAKKLEMIFVSNTNIHSVIFPVKYPHLKKVEFTKHQMTEIDSSFANLVGVEELSVVYGQISSLNPVLERLPNLKKLYVEHNKLTDCKLQIPGLKVLYLPGNPFKDTNAIKRRYPQLQLKFSDGI